MPHKVKVLLHSLSQSSKAIAIFLLEVGLIMGLLSTAWSPVNLTTKAAASDYALEQITTLLTEGLRPQWSHDGNWIAYDHLENNGSYDVYRIHPDDTGNECLTCGRNEVPKSNGAPNFHPTDRYLVFSAEKKKHGRIPPFSTVDDPGAGIYHDLTVLDIVNGEIHHLTDVGSGLQGEAIGGSLHPRFSHDGTKLAWGDFEDSGSNQARFGNWRIAVADFVPNPEPHLENVTHYNPGTRTEWYEVQSWTLDDSGIYFACAPLEGQDDHASDLCHMVLATQELTRLTLTSGVGGELSEFEEHGELSPLGDAFAFMSSAPHGIDTTQPLLNWLRTDLWIMNPDGSGKMKLTHFNDPGFAESDPQGERVMVSKMGWNPDATKLVASVFFVNSEATFGDDEAHLKIFDFSRLLTHDVAVTAMSADALVVQGTMASVDVTAENRGINEEIFDVILEDLTDAVTVGTQSLTLAPGASAVVSFSWNTTGASPGDHTLEAEAVLSTDESTGNNTKTTIATVELPVTDLTITAVTAPGSVVQSEVVDVTVTVGNVGNQIVPADIMVTLTDVTDSVTIGLQTITAGLTASESAIVAFDWDTTDASLGEHVLSASHDVVDDVDANDSNSTTVVVNDATAGVTVNGITPNSMPAGTSVEVTVTGSGFEANADLSFQNGSGPAPTGADIVVVDVDTITATITSKSGGPPVDRVWDVRVTNPNGSSGVLVGGFTVTP